MSAKLIRPELFSHHFGISNGVVDKAGFIDPIMNCDTKLFIDPMLLETSSNLAIKGQAFDLLKSRFSEVIQLVSASAKNNDIAWRTAMKKLDLSEAPETCLGYGGASIGGSSRPDSLKHAILTTAKEIVELGESNPQIISLMGLFEEGVGPDTISDMTTNFIKPILAQITSDFCGKNKISIKPFRGFEFDLPENPYRPGFPILLVPQDILRHLPIAADWDEVSNVVMEVQAIRDAVNEMIGDITKATITEQKDALKRAALQSLENFKELLEILLNSGMHYDANEDIFGHYAFRKILSSDLTAFKVNLKRTMTKDKAELVSLVSVIIEHFKTMVEDNNLWEMLWNGEKNKRERASQLLLFAVADAFCKANNIDISPEMNAGGGPVDFKFSSGYANRILVEVKLSTGTVVHGYEKQLEVYKSASNTDAAFFLVIFLGNDSFDKKLEKIKLLQKQRRDAGDVASEIVVVDARQVDSASKR